MKKLNGLTKKEIREKLLFEAVLYKGMGQGYAYMFGKYDQLKDEPDLANLTISYTQPHELQDIVDNFKRLQKSGIYGTFNEFFDAVAVEEEREQYDDCVRYGKIVFIKYFETKKGFEAIKLFKIKNSLFLFHMINNEVKLCQEVSNELKTPAE